MTSERIAIEPGLLSEPLDDLASVRLIASRCKACDETSLGTRHSCPNCGESALEQTALGTRGTLWTYTVVRHRPPGAYRGPEPFEPMGQGLVELVDRVRILTPLRGDLDRLAIGLPMRLQIDPLYRDEAGREVIAFAFAPA
jgi:uncharacterized OB-fold protein